MRRQAHLTQEVISRFHHSDRWPYGCGALYSPCEKYRYKLWRQWAKGINTINWLMLNPSTATELANDPTVERCEQRSRAWGFQCMTITNLFAWRATDPKAMKKVPSPVGPRNDHYIRETAQISEIVVCAWGEHGKHRGRAGEVLRLLKGIDLYYLKMNGDGQPAHPLYLRYDLTPELWS